MRHPAPAAPACQHTLSPPRPGRWQYYGGRRNPLDASTPARTVEASGISVRLFDAALADGSRALLKEYLGDEARAIGQRELDIYEHLDAGGGFAKLDVGVCARSTPGHPGKADARGERQPSPSPPP